MKVPRIDASALKQRFRGGKEYAAIDVREEGLFARGHLLLASCLPLSRLELTVKDHVPLLTTPITLIDEDESLAEVAALRLASIGYVNLEILHGGVGAWKEAGGRLFSGVDVPSKAFGEFVEVSAHTPSISAVELKSMLDRGDNVQVLDSRPFDEYRRMTIPGSTNVPGAELLHRFQSVVHDPTTLVVVNCAGRTRSIIGAQSLINAKIVNKVVALRNGTMGWHLAGFALEHGADRRADDVTMVQLRSAIRAAAKVANAAGVRTIGSAEYARWLGERHKRTLYILDVRSPEEFALGHLFESRCAPGGQLVQTAGRWIGVRNARVVIVDDTGVRAKMTAAWLLQMGYPNVAVLEDAFCDRDLLPGPESKLQQQQHQASRWTEPDSLRALLGSNLATVIDFGRSKSYREHHIPGAWFAIRSRFKHALPRIDLKPQVILTSDEPAVAVLAAPEVEDSIGRPVSVLRGGNAAWASAGFTLEAGSDRMCDEAIDEWYAPYDLAHGVEDAMKDYLGWEIDLVEGVRSEGDLNFNLSFAPSFHSEA
jgi:rhodanese-related sulfurtransferase